MKKHGSRDLQKLFDHHVEGRLAGQEWKLDEAQAPQVARACAREPGGATFTFLAV
jgi:hypothetical protein